MKGVLILGGVRYALRQWGDVKGVDKLGAYTVSYSKLTILKNPLVKNSKNF